MEEEGWSPDMALGIPLFDEAHEALAEQIKTLMQSKDEDFAAGLEQLVDCLDADFRHEETLMEAIDYPALHSHREQHARVLSKLNQLNLDDLKSCRTAVGLVLPWFHAHLATADTALAIALQMSGLDLDEASAKAH
ncbi:hemerythrin family protein [Duganella sp. BJB1802]|uniref:bacteriohemerythrin n=1 Tax=Duganella sp. BJB1802 TaxID=2744575 RepID=UPI00159315F0|nr:hemerythrin family protein [Duganella sp. BJB1802]NVD73350.1 hemerythrin family protein [Duganella sp. BJB1802]